MGSGRGKSLVDVMECIKEQLQKDIKVSYSEGRNVDLKEIYLDASRYIREFGEVEKISLEEGILRTALFLKVHY